MGREESHDGGKLAFGLSLSLRPPYDVAPGRLVRFEEPDGRLICAVFLQSYKPIPSLKSELRDLP